MLIIELIFNVQTPVRAPEEAKAAELLDQSDRRVPGQSLHGGRLRAPAVPELGIGRVAGPTPAGISLFPSLDWQRSQGLHLRLLLRGHRGLLSPSALHGRAKKRALRTSGEVLGSVRAETADRVPLSDRVLSIALCFLSQVLENRKYFAETVRVDRGEEWIASAGSS